MFSIKIVLSLIHVLSKLIMVDVNNAHSLAMMAIVHRVTAGNANRSTLELTVRERLIVQHLGMSGNESIAALGKEFGISASSMTNVVDRLEEKGYISRLAHVSDRRATLLKLKPKGQSAFKRELDFYGSLVNESLAPLGTKAMTQVLDALLKFDPQSQFDIKRAT
jgi:DNA-binding MarR family transcriptional regulator